MELIPRTLREAEREAAEKLVGKPLPFELRPGDNPLLDLYNKFGNPWKKLDADLNIEDYKAVIEAVQARPRCLSTFSWSVPTPEAIALIKALGPVVEMGAGTGYWAALLRNAGVDVVAFDKEPGENNWCNCLWTDVKYGLPPALKRVNRDRNLLLSWPPHQDPMGSQSIKYFQGEHVFYVGEWKGCTGDDALFNRLERDFVKLVGLALPQWDGVHDDMTVWKRKEGKS